MNIVSYPQHDTRIPDKKSTAMDKQKPRSKTSKVKPRAVVISQGGYYLMTKDSHQKSVLAPLSQEQQVRFLPADGVINADEAEDKLDVPVVALEEDKADHQCQKALRKASQEERRTACRSLCGVGSLLASPAAAWQLLLLAMLARVLDLALPHLAGTPAVQLSKTSSVPQTVTLLLELVNGTPHHKGKGWKLSRPSALVPFVPIGHTAPSLHPVTYAGGELRLEGKKRAFWLPLTNVAVAVHPGFPPALTEVLLLARPLSIPVFCGGDFKKKAKTNPPFILDSGSYLSVDPEVLKHLEENTGLIHAELSAFFHWLRDKGKRWRECLEAREAFLPRMRQGRFEQRIESPEALVCAISLALFQSFLKHAEKQSWLSHEEAQATLMEVWRLVLPESAPKHEAGEGDEGADEKTDEEPENATLASSFWNFLAGYLSRNSQYIVPIGTPGTEKTVAACLEKALGTSFGPTDGEDIPSTVPEQEKEADL